MAIDFHKIKNIDLDARGARGGVELVSDRHLGPIEVLPTFYTCVLLVS